jgi:hypothetical protein
VDRVEPQICSPGASVTVSGSNLGEEGTRVRLVDRILTPSSTAERELKVSLPMDLPAGVRTLQIVRQRALGVPALVHPGTGFESNTHAIVVAPQITTVGPITVARGAVLVLAITPPVGVAQRVGILIGDQLLSPPPRSTGDPLLASSVSCTVPASIAPGTYLLRVQVDGAGSPLTVDVVPTSASFNQYIAPTVSVT